MAAEVMDDDQWLYGDTEEEGAKLLGLEKASQIVKENGREDTPTQEEIELLNEPDTVPSTEPVTANTEAPPVESAPLEDTVKSAEAEEDTKEEEDDDESEDDDVQITIGEIKTDPSLYNRQSSYQRLQAGAGGALGRKVDLDAVPQINGQPIFELDPADAAEKPWRLPGADITDYFNYGFTEETWRLYCDKQRKMKAEVGSLNKIAVQSTRTVTVSEPTVFPTMAALPKLPLPLPLPPPSAVVTPTLLTTPTAQTPTAMTDGGQTADGEGGGESDGKATPELAAQDGAGAGVTLPLKPPLMPPPILPPTSLATLAGGLPPPPFGLPPPGFPGAPPTQDQSLAAAMAAAMFGGLRPPDVSGALGTIPPPPGGFPPIPPHGLGLPGGLPDGLHPPFPGMPFPPPGDHGPLRFDDRGPLPPDINTPFPWDPAMGPPPPGLFDGFRPRSRSQSRSSSSRSRSGRSRSSSYDRYKRSSRRHRRKSRSRSRDRDRDRHKSSRHHRSDHHRSDRHDRDKDRDRDRRSRREHREDRSRHERSSRRHRSTSRDKDEERSSRKEKQKTSEETTRESRSRSRTPPA